MLKDRPHPRGKVYAEDGDIQELNPREKYGGTGEVED